MVPQITYTESILKAPKWSEVFGNSVDVQCSFFEKFCGNTELRRAQFLIQTKSQTFFVWQSKLIPISGQIIHGDEKNTNVRKDKKLHCFPVSLKKTQQALE